MTTLRRAARSLLATRRLSLAAIACAAVGLAAATFMTTLVQAVLFARPPLADADRIVRVWIAVPGSRDTSDVSYQDVLELQRRVPAFDQVDAATRTRLPLTTDAGTERLRGESVTPGYFARAGIRPVVGRLFADDEYRAGAEARPVIISHALWQRRFGGRADIVGQAFRTRPGGTSAGGVRTIVGVMPAGFVGTVDPDSSDFWLPVAHYEPAAALADRSSRATWVLAHLRPGATIEDAQRDVGALGRALAIEHPAEYARVTLVAEPFGDTWRARFRLSLYTLLGATGLLLLVACVNVATLLLARLAERQRDLGVQLMLGATSSRLAIELLVESLMIALAGGIAGLALAWLAVRAVAAKGLFELPSYVPITIEPRTVAASFALVVLTGLLFGVWPARLGAQAGNRRDHGARVTLDRRQRRYGRVLVAAQVGFTCVLLAGAALLGRTYQQLLHVDLGFTPSHLLRMAVSPDPAGFPTPQARLALASEIKRRFEAHAGVAKTAVLAGVLPPWFDDTVALAPAADAVMHDVGRHAVGPDYFDVMGMRITSGRAFAPGDRAGGAASAIVSDSVARRIREATGVDAVGQRVRLADSAADEAAFVDVIGTTNDVTYNGPLRTRPIEADIYVPIERERGGALSIAVATTVDPAALVDPLSRLLGQIAPASPQHWISTMSDELALQYRDARLYASLSGVFGGAAALLAALAIYGALAHHVARRRREIGVRLAVGAQRRHVGAMIVAEGARTVAAGLAAGLLAAGVAGRWLQGLLYGVSPADPWSLTLVALAVAATGLIASAVPALRAARIDPVTALRG